MRLLFIILLLISSIDLASQSDDWNAFIEIINEKNVNTEYSEFAPAFLNEFIVLVKANPRQKIIDKKIKEPYYDLHVAAQYNGSYLNRSENLSTVLNSPYHEGPATFSEDGNQIYYTRVDYAKGEFTLNKAKTVTLKVFQSEYKNGEWSSPVKSDINQEDIPTCHPTLSRDGSQLIFASDRPGGYGKMDLYISYLQNGQWGEPINLGPEINSSGNEWFPQLNKRSYLLYASDSFTLGADLDIYITKQNDEGWLDPIALPSPINSSFDDFGMIIDPDATKGFLTSNRPGGIGKDDIYSFSSSKSLYSYADANYNDINISVKDVQGKNLIGAVIKKRSLGRDEINSFDKNIFTFPANLSDSLLTTEVSTVLTIDEGYTLVEISYPGKENWQIVMSNHGVSKYIDIELQDKETQVIQEPKIVYIEKEVPRKEAIKNVEINVGAVIVFDNIYYDYNSYNLTQGAKFELDELAKIMLGNSNLKIQLSAHTDSRGKSEYNLSLSEKRALAAKTYLVNKGIQSASIQAVGYGETKLRNHCKDNINCTEAEHIYNRRTEVKILEK